MTESANHIIEVCAEMLECGKIEQAISQINSGITLYPADGRFYLFLSAILKNNREDRKAFDILWRALITDPGSKLARDEIRYAVLQDQPAINFSEKDFSLHSGERQVAASVDQIRIDHLVRYEMAAKWITKKFGAAARLKTGLDIFSGNGYGSCILSERAGVKMFGIDGSQEAVNFAERTYGSHRVVFGQALHPFEVDYHDFDFVVSLESIEHVENPEKLITQMTRASRGPLILSFPDEAGLPFQKFGDKFGYHVKHFRRDEIIDLLAAAGRKQIAAEYGQNVYRIERGEIKGLLPPEEMGLCSQKCAPQFRVMIVEPELGSD